MAKLIVTLPEGAPQPHVLDRDRVTIGRRVDNDVCLPYPAVSAEHAVVITIGGDSFLEDLGSTNGTLVNGERVAKHFLRDGDVIDVGRLAITYVARDDEEDAAPADEEAAPADELLADLMESRSTATAALDLAPTLSVVRNERANGNAPPASAEAMAATPPVDAHVTILTGPHAGEATPMNKAQFVFGRPGVSVAAIRRSGGVYRLVPVAGESPPIVNGGAVGRAGAELAFGDTIEVAGVKLRFERRM